MPQSAKKGGRLGLARKHGVMTIQLRDRIDKETCSGHHSTHSSKTPPEIRERIRHWLLSIMKQRDWSAEHWARQANISGTTITRFLNTKDPSRTPSHGTLDKLARAAGVPPMHEPQQVLIAMVHRNSLLTEVRAAAPNPVDLFAMTPDDYYPAPVKFADCRLAGMDNGRYAICRKADARPGQRVLVVHQAAKVCPYWFEPPVLVPVDPVTVAGRHSLPLEGPDHQVLGLMVGEFIEYE